MFNKNHTKESKERMSKAHTGYKYNRIVSNRWVSRDQFIEQQEVRKLNNLPSLTVKERVCLGCEEKFISQGLRICDTCYEKDREERNQHSWNRGEK